MKKATEDKIGRIIVVDKHPAFRSGLAAILNAQPDFQVVATAENAAEGITCYREYEPDLAILDLRLPDMSGVDIILALRQEYPQSRFLILTTFDADEDIYRALLAGAMNYLLKGMSAEDLVSTVRAALSGVSRLSEDIKERLVRHREQPRLTGRELDMIKLLGKGRSNKEIAHELQIGEETVKWYLKNVFQKLNVTDRTQAVVTALQRGLIQF